MGSGLNICGLSASLKDIKNVDYSLEKNLKDKIHKDKEKKDPDRWKGISVDDTDSVIEKFIEVISNNSI